MMKIWIACLMLGCVSIAQAALTDDDIYQAAVPVASQSEQDRAQAIPDALSNVFIKVSGDSHVMDKPAVKAALSKSEKWVEQYGYVLPLIPRKEYRYLLKVRFDANEVDKALDKAKVLIWDLHRPVIVGWVEQEVPEQPAQIIGHATPSKIQLLFKENAERRGLPFLLPMMDITDIHAVSVNDVVAMSEPVLTTASQRYTHDAMLIVRIIQNTHGNTIQAKLIMDKDQWMWNITETRLSNAIAQLMDNVADTLAGAYSSAPREETSTTE